MNAGDTYIEILYTLRTLWVHGPVSSHIHTAALLRSTNFQCFFFSIDRPSPPPRSTLNYSAHILSTVWLNKSKMYK